MKNLYQVIAIYLFGVFWVWNPSYAAICVEADCAALGYDSNATSCTNHFDKLLCPFDETKAICGKEVKTAGSGIEMFYYNEKVYSIKQGNGGVNYTGATNSCSGDWRLPTSSEAYRIAALRSEFSFSFSYGQSSSQSSGILTSTSCSGGHMIAYLNGPSCKPDTTVVSVALCVKEL